MATVSYNFTNEFLYITYKTVKLNSHIFESGLQAGDCLRLVSPIDSYSYISRNWPVTILH